MPEISIDIESNRPVIAANLEELRYLVFQGMKGDTGDSAYELAVELGFEGTEAEWLESLVGPQGEQGIQGVQGVPGPVGPTGADGKNYGIVVDGSTDEVLELKAVEATGGVKSVNGKTGDVTLKPNDLKTMALHYNDATSIQENEDLNNYLTPGSYRVVSAERAGKISNIPEATAGRLFVMSSTGDARVIQLYLPMLNNLRIYARAYFDSWKPWINILTTADKNTINAELAEKANTADLAAVATSGSYNDLTDKPAIPAAVAVDATPTSGSDNAVSSGGVYTALADKQNTLTFDSAPTQNSNNPVTSGGVFAALQNAGSGANLSWEDISGVTLVPGANVASGTISKEFYYCAALGIVRFAITAEASSAVSAGANTLTILFNASNSYKPKLYTGGTADIGIAAVTALVSAIPVPCTIHKGGNSSVGISIFVSSEVGISSGERLYLSGFYYTDDIPTTTGGET